MPTDIGPLIEPAAEAFAVVTTVACAVCGPLQPEAVAVIVLVPA